MKPEKPDDIVRRIRKATRTTWKGGIYYNRDGSTNFGACLSDSMDRQKCNVCGGPNPRVSVTVPFGFGRSARSGAPALPISSVNLPVLDWDMCRECELRHNIAIAKWAAGALPQLRRLLRRELAHKENQAP